MPKKGYQKNYINNIGYIIYSRGHINGSLYCLSFSHCTYLVSYSIVVNIIICLEGEV